MMHLFSLFGKIPPADIYTPDLDLFSFFSSLSGPWVAAGRRGTKDKSALFSLTGNGRAEQHLSPLIHYPTLHLASSGHHTSSFWDLSPGLITHPKAASSADSKEKKTDQTNLVVQNVSLRCSCSFTDKQISKSNNRPTSSLLFTSPQVLRKQAKKNPVERF